MTPPKSHNVARIAHMAGDRRRAWELRPKRLRCRAMSEQSGGPGWWQASDGKWYPPQQATPAVPPPEPTQATPPVYGGPPAAPAYGPPPGPAYGAPVGAAAASGGGAGKVI